MGNQNPIQDLLGQTDIYLIDQIMKGRYIPGETVLDAGCGEGRNMHWFVNQAFTLFGIDEDEKAINSLRHMYPTIPEERIHVSSVEEFAFADNYFDHVICSAVLHFAKNEQHFNEMLSNIVRLVKPGGSVFIRMTSNIGIEQIAAPLGDGRFRIPDGSVRFLLTRKLLIECMKKHPLIFIEPLKTVNVNDLRCMSTLVLRKS